MNLIPCKNFTLTPYLPRSTSNNLCNTQKRVNQFSSNQTIRIGTRIYNVPCFLVPHIQELIELLKTMTYMNAIEFLAEKYNVDIKPRLQNVKRYRYNTNSTKIIPPVTQFSVTFYLGASINIPDPPTNVRYTTMVNDARIISVCNDDTVTFSHTFTDMKKYATYWISTLPDFTLPFYYAVINDSSNPLTSHTGVLLLKQDRLIFIPVILKQLVFLYKPYAEKDTFHFLYISHTLPSNMIEDYVKSKIHCKFKHLKI